MTALAFGSQMRRASGRSQSGYKGSYESLEVEASKETNPASPVASNFLFDIASTLHSCDRSLVVTHAPAPPMDKS